MVLEGLKKKAGDKLLDKVFEMIENIDIIDQLAEMVKSSLPLKAEFTIKGNKKLEINVLGVKKGKLWISVQRIHKKPAEKPLSLEEPAEVEETEQTSAPEVTDQ